MNARLWDGRIFLLSLLSGLVAGGIVAALNMTLLKPYTDAVGEIILDELIANGEYDEEYFDSLLQTLYLTQTGGSVAIGVAAGALIGGTYILGNKADSSRVKNAVVIAGIAWFVLYFVPAVKYPPSLQAIYDAEAASSYYPSYYGYVAISGLSALAIAVGFRKIAVRNKVFAMAALYMAAGAAAFLLFPDYQFDANLPAQTINSWRVSISIAMTTLWFAAGILCGILWTYAGGKGVKDKPRVKT
jgi:hypothetical protein